MEGRGAHVADVVLPTVAGNLPVAQRPRLEATRGGLGTQAQKMGHLKEGQGSLELAQRSRDAALGHRNLHLLFDLQKLGHREDGVMPEVRDRGQSRGWAT